MRLRFIAALVGLALALAPSARAQDGVPGGVWWGTAAASVAAAAAFDARTQGRWPAANAFADLGNAWGLAAPLAFAAARWPGDDKAALRYLEAGALAAVAAGAIKIAVGRARPERHAGPRRFRPGALQDAWHAFPSGHTAFAAAAAGAALADDEAPLALKGAGVSLALATAYARVAKGRHWLSDVTAGLWLGGAIGWFTMKHAGEWTLWAGPGSVAVATSF